MCSCRLDVYWHFATIDAPNGREASDDGVSSVSPGEVTLRQQALDAASSEFLAAEPMGVLLDDTELYSDGTHRPAAVPLSLPVTTSVVDSTAESGASTPRRRREMEGEPGRSVSPRLRRDLGLVAPPALVDFISIVPGTSTQSLIAPATSEQSLIAPACCFRTVVDRSWHCRTTLGHSSR